MDGSIYQPRKFLTNHFVESSDLQLEVLISLLFFVVPKVVQSKISSLLYSDFIIRHTQEINTK